MADDDSELKIIVEELNPSRDGAGLGLFAGTSQSRSEFSELKGTLGKFADAFKTGASMMKLSPEANSTLEKVAFGAGRLAITVGPLATAVGLLERRIGKANELAAKIESNSPQVQLGQAQADIIKLRADRDADRIAGKELRELIKSQARQEAAYTRMQAQLVRSFAPLVNGYQDLKTGMAEIMEKATTDIVASNWGTTEKLLQRQDYYAAIRRGASVEEARRIAAEKTRQRAERGADEKGKVRRVGVDFFTDITGALEEVVNENRRTGRPIDWGF